MKKGSFLPGGPLGPLCPLIPFPGDPLSPFSPGKPSENQRKTGLITFTPIQQVFGKILEINVERVEM